MGLLALTMVTSVNAQTEVTNQYIQNADFGARFAGWMNPGRFSYNVASNFTLKHAEVYMEKWVSSGNKLGNNAGMNQTLRHLSEGTYTLVVSAQNIQQSNKTATQTGAYLYVGNKQVEINEAKDYNIVFTVPENTSVEVGVKLDNCSGNWVCVDNFRLFKKAANADSLATETAAINAEIAELKNKVENATGSVPKVTTTPYMALGTSIILARSTVSGSGIQERGMCWTTDPTHEPTIFDDKTTKCFTETGNLYRLEGLEPATIYYVRAYAITNGYQVGYGKTIKVATMPKGNVSCGYDYAGSQDENYRINSAMQECVWMYNNLCNIRGLYLNVHYVPGAGAGGGTADCSYGGWMRVSQNGPYQQTGTLLHETNHGVGVGTTGEWKNNSNLRENTTHGKWLGPRATQMVRFLENNEGAFMQGDGTHMWAGTTTGTLKYGYGINGAHEDDYQPSNQLLYYGNALITHAMHQDGLISTSQVGFITAAYTYTIADNAKYYIQCENEDNGGKKSFLGMSSTGALRSISATTGDALYDDNYAWYITYNPKTAMYILQNVGTGKYMTNSSGTIKAVNKTKPASTEEFQFIPSREEMTIENWTGSSYWILTSSGHNAMEGGSYSATGSYYAVNTKNFNASNTATSQRWAILSQDDVELIESKAIAAKATELTSLIAAVRAMMQTPHKTRTADADVAVVDAALSSVVDAAEAADDWATTKNIQDHITDIQEALNTFLTDATPEATTAPFDITFLLKNPDFTKDYEGWTLSTGTPNWGNKSIEFTEQKFDINQTTDIKLPIATYEVKAQAFERPGAAATVYTDFVTNGENKATAKLYIKTKKQNIHNICDTCSTSLFTGGEKLATEFYVPKTLNGAQKLFAQGYYDNSQMVETTSNATIKIGISCADTGTAYWTVMDNFRLYCYGSFTIEEIETGINDIQQREIKTTNDDAIYDLQGRRITAPRTHGIYVRNGKKFLF